MHTLKELVKNSTTHSKTEKKDIRDQLLQFENTINQNQSPKVLDGTEGDQILCVFRAILTQSCQKNHSHLLTICRKENTISKQLVLNPFTLYDKLKANFTGSLTNHNQLAKNASNLFTTFMTYQPKFTGNLEHDINKVIADLESYHQTSMQYEKLLSSTNFKSDGYFITEPLKVSTLIQNTGILAPYLKTIYETSQPTFQELLDKIFSIQKKSKEEIYTLLRPYGGNEEEIKKELGLQQQQPEIIEEKPKPEEKKDDHKANFVKNKPYKKKFQKDNKYKAQRRQYWKNYNHNYNNNNKRQPYNKYQKFGNDKRRGDYPYPKKFQHQHKDRHPYDRNHQDSKHSNEDFHDESMAKQPNHNKHQERPKKHAYFLDAQHIPNIEGRQDY
jgi:hypothetical protein